MKMRTDSYNYYTLVEAIDTDPSRASPNSYANINPPTV
jgi:hypothetical protein